MPDWLRDWRKILLYAICTALIFFALYCVFVPNQAGRYRMISETADTKFMYMDTATGKIYTIRGKLFSSPHDY